MKIQSTTITAMIVLMHSSPVFTQDLPDPTRPAEYQTTVISQDLPKALIDWKVTAIRISENDRTAIVNGKLVRIGDVIGPAKILDIQPVQVILDYENRRVAVRLFSDVVIRKQANN